MKNSKRAMTLVELVAAVAAVMLILTAASAALILGMKGFAETNKMAAARRQMKLVETPLRDSAAICLEYEIFTSQREDFSLGFSGDLLTVRVRDTEVTAPGVDRVGITAVFLAGEACYLEYEIESGKYSLSGRVVLTNIRAAEDGSVSYEILPGTGFFNMELP